MISFRVLIFVQIIVLLSFLGGCVADDVANNFTDFKWYVCKRCS